jgi:hypothetical protein
MQSLRSRYAETDLYGLLFRCGRVQLDHVYWSSDDTTYNARVCPRMLFRRHSAGCMTVLNELCM